MRLILGCLVVLCTGEPLDMFSSTSEMSRLATWEREAMEKLSEYKNELTRTIEIVKEQTHKNKIVIHRDHDDLVKTITNYLSKFPGQDQLEGAGNGIFLLQEAYNLNISELSQGIISVKHMSQDKFNSVSSFKYADTDYLGKIAYNRGFYDRAVEWFKAAVDVAVSMEDKAKNLISISRNLLKTTMKTHDKVLEQKGSSGSINGNTWRTNSIPFDEKLRKKKKYKMALKEMKKTKESFNPTFTPNNQDEVLWNQFNRLCRGDILRSAEDTKDLYCDPLHYNDPYLKLGPFKNEVQSKVPFITIFHDFFAESEMSHYKDFARTRLFRSAYGQSASKGGSGTGVKRTSKQTWLYEVEKEIPSSNNSFLSIGPYQYRDQVVVKDRVGLSVSDRIKKATRMFSAEYAGGEAFQVANYGIGGVYNHHPDPHDWQNPSKIIPEDQRHEAIINGDRVATFMGYLSDVPLGGATVFPNAGITIWPEKGSATMWWNLFSNGITDGMTVHGGCPVIVGSKWITNKWIRWKAQEFKLPCKVENNGFTRQPVIRNDMCSDTNTCSIDNEVFLRPYYYFQSLKTFSPEFQ